MDKWEYQNKPCYLENCVVREPCKRRAACSRLATKSCHFTSQHLMLFKVSNCDYSTVGLIWKTHINIWHFTPIIAIIYWVFITKSWSKCFLGNQYQEINHKKQMPLCASGLPASHEVVIRVANVVAHHDELLTQWRYIWMSKLGTNIFLISTTSNYLRSSAVCKNQHF